MNHRRPLTLIAAVIVALAAAGCRSAGQLAPEAPPTTSPTLAAAPSAGDSVVYRVRETLTLVNTGPGAPERQNLWVALIPDAPPFQDVLSMTIDPAPAKEFSDEYGNRYVEFDFAGMAPGTRLPVTIDYEVRVNPVTARLDNCRTNSAGAPATGYTQPELHIESANPEIRSLSAELAQDQPDDCAKVRAFYDYIGSHLVYTYNGRDWGAQAALGPMGADCTEYSDLLIALSRAAGIPARYVEGLYLGPEANARTEHAWVEVDFPGSGWAPVDPTLGRSSLTAGAYFAASPADHILLTRGRNPSPLRGGSYFSHLYWPGNSTTIRVEDYGWTIE